MRFLAKIWSPFWISTSVAVGVTAFIAVLIAKPPFWPVFFSVLPYTLGVEALIVLAGTSEDVAKWMEGKAREQECLKADRLRELKRQEAENDKILQEAGLDA